MDEPTFGTLAQRLDRLERGTRWWKVVASVAMAFVGIVALLGATGDKVPNEIRARRFVVVGENGKRQAQLGDHPRFPSPALVFFTTTLDGKGEHLLASFEATVGVSPGVFLNALDGSRLSLTDRGLEVTSKDGKRTLLRSNGLEFEDSGRPKALYGEWGLNLWGDKGDIQLELGSSGGAFLVLDDGAGNSTELRVERDRHDLAFAENGKIRALLGRVVLEDLGGGRVEISRITLLDKHGKVIWKAP